MRAFPPALPHAMESMRGPGFTNCTYEICLYASMHNLHYLTNTFTSDCPLRASQPLSWSLCHPAEFAGIIKNHVLAGPHPGQDTQALVKNLDGILKAGVTTFVSLQHEMPSLMVTDTVHSSAGTMSARSRRAYGFRNVHTARNYMTEAQAMTDAGGCPASGGKPLSFVHLPITEADGSTVPDEQLKQFCMKLLKFIKAGEVLYVQCADGNGRTGSVAAVLLGLVYGLSSSEALDASQRYRASRAGTGGNSPETHEQKMQVHRVLADDSYRTAAIAVSSTQPAGDSELQRADLAGVYSKLRKALQRLGYNALLFLRKFLGAEDPRKQLVFPVRDFMDRLVTFHPSLFLTSAEADILGAAGSANAGQGWIDVHELVRGVRGRMSRSRADAVHSAFAKMDVGQSGFVEWNDLAVLFKPTGHPDVIGGKRTEEKVRSEFLETFGSGSNFGDLRVGQDAAAQRKVHVTSFEDYWAHISASIEDDNTFNTMMWKVWPVRGNGTFAEPDPARFKQVASPSSLPTATTEHGFQFAVLGSEASLGSELCKAAGAVSEMALPGLRHALLDNSIQGSGCVDQATFVRTARDIGITATAFPDLRLVSLFGQTCMRQQATGALPDSSTSLVHVGDFYACLTGELPPARRKLVLAAFSRLTAVAGDVAGVEGAVPVQVVLGEFNAARHPAVQAGRRSSEEIMRSFVRSFGTGDEEGKVHLPYFESFYEGVSAACGDDDALFKVVMWNTFKLDAPQVGVSPSLAKRRHEYGADSINERAWDGEGGFLSQMERLSGPVEQPAFRPSKVMHAKFYTTSSVSANLSFTGGRGGAAHGVGLGSEYGTRGGSGVGAAVASGVGRPSNKQNTNVFSPPPSRPPTARTATTTIGAAPPSAPGTRLAPALFSPVQVKAPAPRAQAVSYTADTLQRQGHGSYGTPNRQAFSSDPQSSQARQHAAQHGVGSSLGAHFAAAGNIGASPASNAIGVAPGSAHGQEQPDALHFGRDRGRKNFYTGGDSAGANYSKTYRSSVPWDTRDGQYTSGAGVEELRRTALSAHAVTAAGGMLHEAAPGAQQGAVEGKAQVGNNSVKADIKANLLVRGVRAIFGLQRAFWAADVDGAGFVPGALFAQLVRQNGVGTTTGQAQQLVQDMANEHGDVDYTHFLYDVLGNMPTGRRDWAVRVYQSLHHQAMVQQAGGAEVGVEVAGAPIPIDFLRMQFASSEHPAVKHGARAEADVLREFLETFTFHPKHPASAPPSDPQNVFSSGGVSQGDWLHYYNLFSAAIPEDTHFQVILWSVWRQADVPVTNTFKPPTPTQHLPPVGHVRNQAAGTAPGWGVECLGFAATASGRMMQSHSMGRGAESLDVPAVLLRIRNNMARRGQGSIILLAATLRKADEASHASSRLGRLTRSVMRTSLSELSMGISDGELDVLFEAFDAAGPGSASGEIAYEHFLDAMAGPMAPGREEAVAHAWDALSKGGQVSAVPLGTLRLRASASWDKDVKSGRKTENRVKGELAQPFMDACGGSRVQGGAIDQDTFFRVNAHLSACTVDDSTFQLQVWNTWLN